MQLIPPLPSTQQPYVPISLYQTTTFPPTTLSYPYIAYAPPHSYADACKSFSLPSHTPSSSSQTGLLTSQHSNSHGINSIPLSSTAPHPVSFTTSAPPSTSYLSPLVLTSAVTGPSPIFSKLPRVNLSHVKPHYSSTGADNRTIVIKPLPNSAHCDSFLKDSNGRYSALTQSPFSQADINNVRINLKRNCMAVDVIKFSSLRPCLLFLISPLWGSGL